VGEIVAGAAGVLLLVSLFLPWYRGTVMCFRAPCPQPQDTAFQAFAVLDVFLVVVALGGVGLLALEMTQETPAVPVAWAAVLTLIGLIATALVLWRVLAPPADAAGSPVFSMLGLVACAGVTAGSFLSMRNDRPRTLRRSGAEADEEPRGPIRIPDSPGVQR
jgi:hypothetical protein